MESRDTQTDKNLTKAKETHPENDEFSLERSRASELKTDFTNKLASIVINLIKINPFETCNLIVGGKEPINPSITISSQDLGGNGHDSEIEISSNPSITETITPPFNEEPSVDLPTKPSLLHSNYEFAQDLLVKTHENFPHANIGLNPKVTGYVNSNILLRAAYTTTICEDNELKGADFLPSTPKQTDDLIQEGKHPAFKKYLEEIALVLDCKGKENNVYQKQLSNLIKDQKVEFPDLGRDFFKNNKLEYPLMIWGLGLEEDEDLLPYNVKFKIIQGTTKVCIAPLLDKEVFSSLLPQFKSKDKDENELVGVKNLKLPFNYASNNGIPSLEDITLKGKRSLGFPINDQDLGLRRLTLNLYGDLDVGLPGLICEDDSRSVICFVPQE